jgi:hypothetical protein
VTRLLALVTDTTTATASATTTVVVVASITATHPGSQPCDGQARKIQVQQQFIQGNIQESDATCINSFQLNHSAVHQQAT